MTTTVSALQGTEHYIYRKHGKLYVYQVGGGEPVIFLHAAGQSGWFWRPVVDRVSHHFACYNIDMPGFDHSDIPPRQYSMEDYAAAIVDVLDGIGLERTNIVATRTGAIVSVVLAATYPERVNRMVLDGLPYWDKRKGQVVYDRYFAPMFTDTTTFHIPVSPIPTLEKFKQRFPRHGEDVFKKEVEGRQKSRLWTRLTQEKNTDCDVTSYGPKVKAPTLLIYGDEDVLRRGEAQALDDIKGSIVKVVPDCPPVPPAHQSHPDEVANLAIEFLNAS
jgi:pimeloyl-ACP methyl ester carboxylesterase